MKRFFNLLVFFLIISLTLPQNFSLASQSFALVPETLGVGEITTLVGSDRAFGDGGPALQASLNAPKAMIFDKAGNLIIADTNNHRVRKINLTTGEITTIAGIGTAGFTGDGEPAARTKLNFPNGLAIDERGNIFISDSGNHRIRRVDVDSSVITTVAGNGEMGQDKDNVLATQTSLTNPFSLAIDKLGNIYVLQLESFRVRRIDSSSRMITTFAGNGRAGVSRDGEIAASTSIIPVAINVDNQNNLLIVETSAEPKFDNILLSNRVRQVNTQTGVLSTIAGNGCNPFRSLSCTSIEGEIATKTSLIFPLNVTVDELGNLFIIDDTQVKMVSASTGAITTIAGNGEKQLKADNGDGGTAKQATLFPFALAARASELFILDSGYDQVRRVSLDTNTIDSIAGVGIGDGKTAKASKLNVPTGLAVDSTNNLFIADTSHNLVRKVNATTGVITTIAGTGKNNFNGDGKLAIDTDLSEPIFVAVDGKDNLFIVERTSRIRRLDNATKTITTLVGDGTAGFSGDNGKAILAKLNNPTSIVIDDIGNIFIADTANHRIRRVDNQTGNITTIAGNGMAAFSGDGGAATNASLDSPTGLALANNTLFIVDNSNRVRSVSLSSGIISTFAGSGKIGFKGDNKTAKKASFQFPKSLATDRESLFIADTGNNRIRAINLSTGVITTIAGDGVNAYAGDNGAATKASLSAPTNIAIDKVGNLFISDQKNNVVRVIKN